MKPLKTKYPCTSCGQPAEVNSRKEAEWAKCPRCHERDRLVSMAVFKGKSGNKSERARAGETMTDVLARGLRAIECHAGAAALFSQASQFADPRERRRLLSVAAGRLRWVIENARKIEECVAAEALVEATGVEALDGGREPATVEAAPPVLRLIRCGDEP